MENWLTKSFASGSGRVLPDTFFARKTLSVAVDLLGKLVALPEPCVVGRIVETEAYFGEDPASHSSRGLTPRTSIMFGPPGRAYVYFIYGMYEMLNFVTEPEGKPGAVLIRAIEPVFGEERMLKRRKIKTNNRSLLTSGPGKLTRAMGIKMKHNGEPLQGPNLFVIDDGYTPKNISASGRVGISMAQDEPWRYFISDHPFVSKAPQNKTCQIFRKGA
jgi:DNA-3-methyladenine glycosylase